MPPGISYARVGMTAGPAAAMILEEKLAIRMLFLHQEKKFPRSFVVRRLAVRRTWCARARCRMRAAQTEAGTQRALYGEAARGSGRRGAKGWGAEPSLRFAAKPHRGVRGPEAQTTP